MDEAKLLDEQQAYYRARAREYDSWWLREGRYDHGPEANARWFEEVTELEQAVQRFGPGGDVLELACGTGLWTRVFAGQARRLMAVDAAPEVLEINRARVGDAGVQYVQADLFAWDPPKAAFDVCFFSFWLSHVPESRFAAFWEKVRAALRPAGRVFLIDSARSEQSGATDHAQPPEGQRDHDQTPRRRQRVSDRQALLRSARARAAAGPARLGSGRANDRRVLHLRGWLAGALKSADELTPLGRLITVGRRRSPPRETQT